MIWIDAQLSPHLAPWIAANFNIPCVSLKYISLHTASDIEIYNKAKIIDVIIISKDIDFVDLINRLGSPPKLILISCGNTSNNNLKRILKEKLSTAINLLLNENIVEISD